MDDGFVSHHLGHPWAFGLDRARMLLACQREMDVLGGNSAAVIVSDHADTRMKERLGLPKSARHAAAVRAYTKGKLHADARGALRRYLDGKWRAHGNCNNVRLYGDNIWFFAGTCLVTVYAIPKALRGGL